jgi:hypothetical protein
MNLLLLLLLRAHLFASVLSFGLTTISSPSLSLP